MVKKKSKKESENMLSRQILGLIIVATVIMLFNQIQVNGISDMLSQPSGIVRSSGSVDLASLDVTTLTSTAHTIAAVFPVDQISTMEDAMAIMFPTGIPEYGEALGVSYDDPVGSLAVLAGMYRGLKAEVEANDPEAFQQFVDLASNPRGVSCEYCCGVGPIGVDKNGNSRCGCKHNPALLSTALYLSAYTDYNDGEILQEVMKWKTLFFPKNMIEIGLSLGGGDTSVLEDLPGMVGGC